MRTMLSKFISLRFWMGIITTLNLFALLLSYSSPFIHPDTIKVIPLFGLAYPFIFTTTILLLIFWIFVRSKWTWGIIIIITLGGTLHFRTFSFGTESKTEHDSTLKIMSYNVQLFGLYSTLKNQKQEKKIAIFNYLREKQPDVICFQEFYKKKKRNFITKDSIIKILDSKFYHEKYAKQFGEQQSFGIALFSKFPIINKGEIYFDKEDENFNYCIYADIVKDIDTFRIYNVHLKSIRFDDEDYKLFSKENIPLTKNKAKFFALIRKVRNSYPIRAKQAGKIMTHVKDSPYPVIICGDFNDTPMSYVYNQFNSFLNDAFRETSFGIGSTYAGKIPIGRIDYIFHSREIKSSNFQIQKEALSDHFAISCEIGI